MIGADGMGIELAGAGGVNPHRNLPPRIHIGSKVLRKPEYQRETPVALENLSGLFPSDGDFNDILHF